MYPPSGNRRRRRHGLPRENPSRSDGSPGEASTFGNGTPSKETVFSEKLFFPEVDIYELQLESVRNRASSSNPRTAGFREALYIMDSESNSAKVALCDPGSKKHPCEIADMFQSGDSRKKGGSSSWTNPDRNPERKIIRQSGKSLAHSRHGFSIRPNTHRRSRHCPKPANSGRTSRIDRGSPEEHGRRDREPHIGGSAEEDPARSTARRSRLGFMRVNTPSGRPSPQKPLFLRPQKDPGSGSRSSEYTACRRSLWRSEPFWPNKIPRFEPGRRRDRPNSFLKQYILDSGIFPGTLEPDSVPGRGPGPSRKNPSRPVRSREQYPEYIDLKFFQPSLGMPVLVVHIKQVGHPRRLLLEYRPVILPQERREVR